jgi:hypothetical protein
MRRQTLYWLALPLVVGALAYFASSGELRRTWSLAFGADPVIDYPEVLELGEREIGDQVVAPFTITNRGRGLLTIDQVQTNCSCSGIEEQAEASFSRVDSLSLRPGERANLVMRIAVRGVPNGSRMSNVVQFRTNDPARPVAQIEAVVSRVWSGVACYPPSVVFETVPIGAAVTQIIEVRDTADPPRSIERLSTTDPDRVSLRMLGSPVTERGGDRHPDGRVIGRFEIAVSTLAAGPVAAKVHVHLEGSARPPDAVAVAGRIAEPVEVSPSAILLPRASADGLVYSAACVCQSTNGQPLSLVLDHAPQGLTADLLREDDPTRYTIRVRWDPEAGKGLAGGKHIILFKARLGKKETELRLPVLIRG